MVSVPGGHFSKGAKYGSEEIRIYSLHVYGLVGEVFLYSAITEDLKRSVPGKRVLDIGCGAGKWCVTAAQYGAKSVDREPPIMLIILPIMLCCTAQKFTYYAQIYAQYLPIMLNYLCLSSHALLIIFSLWINDKWLKH